MQFLWYVLSDFWWFGVFISCNQMSFCHHIFLKDKSNIKYVFKKSGG